MVSFKNIFILKEGKLQELAKSNYFNTYLFLKNYPTRHLCKPRVSDPYHLFVRSSANQKPLASKDANKMKNKDSRVVTI